ncbi:MAG: Hsp70 family protein, partial [Planctomycetales bacterium]|nr:Hsp70 family protein [Planctomycetales bacterium]
PFGDVNDRLTVMVYDLGGGTFDVTVMEMKPGSLETLATDGDVRLGGTDWDQRICDELWRRMQAEHPQIAALDPAARFRLRNLAEDVKQTLSTRQETSVRFEHAGAMVQLVFTRALLEEMTRDLLDRTAFTMRQALRAAGRSWDQVARVLLVGGSSRMPMVRRMVEEVSGIEPDVNVDPGEAVARGAAIFAEHRLTARLDNEQRRAGLRISEVNSHSLGIEGIHQSNMRKENVILIPRNTPLPAETKRSFVTKVDNQPTVVIQVLEGESKVPAECAKLGRAVIRNLADCRLPAGTPIEVKYQYSSNGRFHVEASLTAGGEQARIELRRNRGLSSEHLTRWTRILTQDGGFDTFQLALQELLDQQQLDEDEELIEFEIDDADEPNRLELESAPALPYGAPQAAADELQRSAPQLTPIAPRIRTTPRRRTRHSILINLCGHLIASLLGLVMGYYILCWLRPDMNFLQLSLPGLP